MTQQLSKDDYKAWLSTQGWRIIQSEAETVNFDKADDQKWVEVIDEIVELKYPPQVEDVQVEQSVQTEAIAIVSEKAAEVNFDYIKVDGIRICPVCNYPMRTALESSDPICPTSVPNCPRLGVS